MWDREQNFQRKYKAGPYVWNPPPSFSKVEVSLRSEYELVTDSKRCEVEIRFLTFEMPTAQTIDEVMFDVQERVKEMLGLNVEI